jgi:aryl-alcohol dehydrogenase-like predicted oxidoreductase
LPFSNHKDGKCIVEGDLEYVQAACEASLKRLDVEEIDIYCQHYVDINVPIEITVRDAPSCPCDAVACKS